MSASRPFCSDSLTGFELELLAPRGQSRLDLASALAERRGGSLRYGFKYSSEGAVEDGRPVCTLTPAYRVLDSRERPVATLVDDTTIRNELDQTATTPAGLYRVVMDDVRFALWAEAESWSQSPAAEATLAHLIQTFGGALEPPGEAGAQHPEHRILRDPYGHVWAVVGSYPGERQRVCEVVTRPLLRPERRAVITEVLDTAIALGFTIPEEAALHLHFDAAPWQETHRLTGLILTYDDERHLLRERFGTNPRCRRLGAFSEKVLRVARECPPDLPFRALATALETAGATKDTDINIQWVIRPFPVQPTLELRFLPMRSEASALFELVEAAEDFLLRAWETAPKRKR